MPKHVPKARQAFFGNLQALMEKDDDLLAKIIFSDEANLHLSGKVNRYNVRIWRSENPHATLEAERDSPKLNVLRRIEADCTVRSSLRDKRLLAEDTWKC